MIIETVQGDNGKYIRKWERLQDGRYCLTKSWASHIDPAPDPDFVSDLIRVRDELNRAIAVYARYHCEQVDVRDKSD